MDARNAIPDRKPEIINLLKLLASEQMQLAYEKDVPVADVPAELVCMWFDDLYCPGDKFFQSCFKSNELEALSAFNQFYDEQKKVLPKDYAGIDTWLGTTAWREIMNEADKTLHKMDV